MKISACISACILGNFHALADFQVSTQKTNVQHVDALDTDRCALLQTHPRVITATDFEVKQSNAKVQAEGRADRHERDLYLQRLPLIDNNFVGKWFFPISLVISMISFVSMLCAWCSRYANTPDPDAKRSVSPDPPLCPTFVSMKRWSLCCDTEALDLVKEIGCDIFTDCDSDTPYLRAEMLRTDVGICISRPGATPRAAVTWAGDRSFAEEVSTRGAEIRASDGDMFGRLKQESDKVYQVEKDSDSPVLSFSWLSLPSTEGGVQDTIYIDAVTANGQLVASVVQTYGVRGRTEIYIKPGADVALVLVCALALLTFGKREPPKQVPVG
jgi:hypothetical protein